MRDPRAYLLMGSRLEINMNDISKGLVIYALCEPYTKAVRYVGKTCDMSRRLEQHYQRQSNVRLYRWLQILKDAGLTPEGIFLESTDADRWRQCEKKWILKY